MCERLLRAVMGELFAEKYPRLLAELEARFAEGERRIQSARTRAVLAVNAGLVHLYWDIGRLIAERQQREGGGAAVTNTR
ncbi:MAG: DUF1016 N-terminal domain-containing protein [Burkholderiales bacterium]